MTRLQKKLLGEMLQTIKGAIDQANSAIRENDVNKLQSLLSACQESAIAIGTEIEGLEGEGTKTVGILEAFCEEIYNASLKADAGKLFADLTKEISAKLDDACKKLEEEIKVKSTVLFLPFAAKWWDGLETIWRKEKKNPDTEVYVVPVPWYETSFESVERKFHYDLEAYPEEVKALDYRNFDIGGLHPDVIYIQDASDGQGFARNVDRRFYTAALKPFTDDLVYIPYKIEIEPDINKEEQLGKLEKNALVAGVDNVDTIIVQSSNMREAYIKILSERDEAGGIEEGKDWPSIIKGTGHPRVEKITSIKKEDIDIPKDWIPFIQSADGSRKKIILYGNSVYTFLESSGSIIAKLRDSFRIFKENADKVALIWRPHPETGEILRLLRPEIATEYENLVKEFLDDRIGILDKDEDFTKAVILSDAFYGDDSLMVSIYRATEKPIMIEDVELFSSQQG